MTFASERLMRPQIPGYIRYLNQRMPGETPHDLDDFFDDDDYSEWTTVQTSGTTTPTEKYGKLSLIDTGTSTRDLNGMAKSIGAASSPLTIETAFSWIGGSGNPGAAVALGFIDGTASTSNNAVINVFAGIGNTSFNAGTLDTYDTTATNHFTRGSLAQTGRVYLRIVWKSANTFRIALSTDGVSWRDIAGADQSKTMTPTDMILGVSAYGTAAVHVGFDYFRAYDADLIT